MTTDSELYLIFSSLDFFVYMMSLCMFNITTRNTVFWAWFLETYFLKISLCMFAPRQSKAHLGGRGGGGSLAICNRPYSYSWYWTGTSLEWRLMRGNIIKKRLMSFTFEKTPRISLTCKLVPVQYREYEYGLLDRWTGTLPRRGCNVVTN